MRRTIAVCSVVVLAVFGTAACAGGEGQQEEVELLEERIELLEDQVQDLQILVGAEVAEEPEEPQQEQTQPEQTQPENTQ